MDFYTPHQTKGIEIKGDFTYTGESTSPGIDMNSLINKGLGNEQSINLTKPTMIKQHKVAAFVVKRNEKKEIISSELYKEGWIEVTHTKSPESGCAPIHEDTTLLIAKQFKIPVDLFDSIVIKNIYEVEL